MKKFIRFMMIALLVSSFSGCNKIRVKDGTEAAKILLANERLDGSDLRKDGNIFTKGKKAFDRIKTETQKYSKRLEEEGVKSKFNKSGNTYSWSDAPDYSNFLSFFNSYAENIEHNADVGSKLIDSTKNNVRIVNKWIEVGMFSDEEILLIVEENKETIFSRSGAQYEICRRFQNEDGSNVFEMSIENYDTNSRCRMTYIPGQRYEYASEQNEHTLVIIADNEKGYWDIMTTSTIDGENEHYSFTNLVMKDEAIYETSYSVENRGEYFDSVEIVTGDGKSDILAYNKNTLTLYTTGINGLDSFYINATDDEVWHLTDHNHERPENHDQYKVFTVGEEGDRSYFTDTGCNPTVKFSNGKEMNAGDSFYDGAVTVASTMVHPIGGIDFYGDVQFRFKEDDIDFIFDNLRKLSNDFGFTFKDDFDVVYEATKYANQDKVNFSKYYLWQGNHINNIEDIRKSFEKERELIYSFVNLYNEVKDFEVIKKGDQARLEASYHFADVSLTSKGNVTSNDFNININNLTVKSNDTVLFVKGEPYKVEIAVANKVDGQYVNIMPIIGGEAKVYTEGSTFEVSFNGNVELPILVEGDYELVAYVATNEEGIRVTKPIAIEGSVVNAERSLEGVKNRLYSENNIIKIKSSEDLDIIINLSESYTYSSLYNELESYAYKYGQTTNDSLEIQNGSTWNKVNENDSITSGTYRLRYINGNNDAYVIATLN